MIVVCINCQILSAQDDTLHIQNTIGWYNCFATFRLTERIGLHTEYQWRRSQFITHPQQSLLRLGINYNPGPSWQIRLGYAWVETSAYGEIPVNAFDRDFTEHRTFQLVQYSKDREKVSFIHRGITEQRFVGRYSSRDSDREEDFPMSHRLRYMIKVDLPLSRDGSRDRKPYLSNFIEAFISYGEKANHRGLEQLRMAILLGYQFSQKLRIECGWLYQNFRYGRKINDNVAFQVNSGMILNCVFNVDMTTRSTE